MPEFEETQQESMRDRSYTEPQEEQSEHAPEVRTPDYIKKDKAVAESLLNVKEVEY